MHVCLRRTPVALVAAALLGTAAPAGAALSIPANTWVKQPTPTQVLLSGFPGTFQARGWNHMLFDPVGKRMILYDGYLDASRPYNIYANALWTYNVLTNQLSLETVSNWVWSNGYTVPLAANTTNPTPFDRHSYACIQFVPELNRLYIWGGANASVSTDWIGDTWVYDFTKKAWHDATGTTHPFNVLQQAASYDPNVHRMVIFGGASAGYGTGDTAWLFDVTTELWEPATTASSPPARMGQSMVFDPLRRVTYMFGGGSPFPTPGNEMWAFDASARVWQQLIPQNTPPPVRQTGALAYDSKHDIVMLWGGRVDNTTVLNDTWIYLPSTRQWQKLLPPTSPPATVSNNEDLAYDVDNDVFILHDAGDFWLFRYAPSGDSTAPADVQDLRIR
ncbi:MAG: kelch repeat-containing protein [Bacteroidota bacterium]